MAKLRNFWKTVEIKNFCSPVGSNPCSESLESARYWAAPTAYWFHVVLSIYVLLIAHYRLDSAFAFITKLFLGLFTNTKIFSLYNETRNTILELL